MVFRESIYELDDSCRGFTETDETLYKLREKK